MIRKTIVLLIVLLMAFSVVSPYRIQGGKSDYSGHWAEEVIQQWIDKGYTNVYSDGSFKPEEFITRVEFIKMINTLFCYTEKADISFIDADPAEWYYPEIQKAIKAGYISGISDIQFSPGGNLTREQAAAIISKIMKLETNYAESEVLSDKDNISSWALGYVGAVVGAQYIKGYEDNTFRPKSFIKRAEAVVTLNKTMKTAAPADAITGDKAQFTGTLLDGTCSLTDWQKAGANTVMSLDSVNYKNGNAGIKLVSSDMYPDIIKWGLNGKFKKVDQLAFWVYIPDVSKLTHISVSLSSVLDFSKCYVRTFTIDRSCSNGWNWLVINKDDMINQKNEDWDSIDRIRLKAFVAPGQTAELNFGGIYLQPEIKPVILISFDDADATVYKKAYPILKSRGAKGTFYINSNRVGSAGYVTLEQLKQMYNDGWDISNHTADHKQLIDAPDDLIATELNTCTNFLINNDLSRGAYHLSYPFGGKNRHIEDVVKQLGFLTARSTIKGIQYNTPNNVYDMPVIVSLNSSTTVEIIRTAVDNLKRYGGTGLFYGHIIKDVAASEYEVSASVLQELVDYAYSQNIEMITISEWYKRMAEENGL